MKILTEEKYEDILDQAAIIGYERAAQYISEHIPDAAILIHEHLVLYSEGDKDEMREFILDAGGEATVKEALENRNETTR